MPTVSVIMGVYNCKNFELLNKSVESIINQTYEDWEFLICNDGSTDYKTYLQLKEIEQKDSRIRILSYSNNKGLSYALNCCLKNAKGKYIARQDDDDISRPERLQKEVEFLQLHNEFGFVGTIADVFDDDGIWGEYNLTEYPTKKSFYWNSPFIHPTIMVRAEVYRQCGGYRVAKETRRCEDLDMFMRMYAMGILGANIQEKLYEYRMENNKNTKYRPMKYRIDEAVVKYKGYKNMGVLVRGIPYVLKPILVGLIPQKVLYYIKRKQY